MRGPWGETALRNTCEKTKTIKWSHNEDKTFKYIDLSSVSRSSLSITETSEIRSDTAPSRAKKIVMENDVIFATTRPTLRRATIISNNYNNQICSTGFAVLRPKEEMLLSKYLFYFIISESFLDRMQTLQRGASYPAVSDKDVFNATIRFPISLSEQKQIVAILDKAFAAIDQAKANIERNIENAKELFQSKLNEIFSQQGEGWETVVLEEVTELITKGSSPKWQGVQYIETPEVLFVTSENVGSGKMLLDKKKYLERKFNEIETKSILKKGDVLTNIVGASIGRTAIFDLEQTANINQAVCLIRCDVNLIYNRFLMHLLNSPYLLQVMSDNEINMARANLSLTFFRKLRINLPSTVIQQAIVIEIDKLQSLSDRVIRGYRTKLHSLEELKKSLLQKAFTGELTNDEAKVKELINEPLGMVAEEQGEYKKSVN